jgi:hypothetical protein
MPQNRLLITASCLLTILMLLGVTAAAASTEIDYAESRFVDSWLRHPVYGDPSFDSFERFSGNPVHTGAPPFGWPVNGFFFADPGSGNWYLYIGDYATGYLGPPPSRCILYRSRNLGRTWENLGPILQGDARMFDKNGHTPDVSVVFAEGRYHMVYDWGEPNFNADGGLAYAWAEKPEGPWRRDAQPITRNSTLAPLLGRYQRTYAATLLRRKRDWLILAMMDSAPHRWALFAMTAARAQGPYSERRLVRNVEGDYFHPPLMEFFPAFAHGGWVYAPATSVAGNRDFQVLFRAPLEEAADPAAWEIFRYGSCWHSEDVPHEAFGIWGQTFAGWVDPQGIFQVLFPSRTAQGNGTINLASRPWSRPLGERGFHLAGHQSPSLALLRCSYREFTLEADLRLRGTARIMWGYQAPLGPDRPASDARLHPLSLTRHQALELSPTGWRIIEVDAAGKATTLASGDGEASQVRIQREGGGVRLALGGRHVWSGSMSAATGAVGLLAGANSHLFVNHFRINGEPSRGNLAYLYTDAWLGAGENPADWIEQRDPRFRFGVGAVRRAAGGRAKWNFVGAGFTLWSPTGPEYGSMEVRLDGAVVATVDLHRTQQRPSAPVFTKKGMADTFHAVVLLPKTGRLVVDSLDGGG